MNDPPTSRAVVRRLAQRILAISLTAVVAFAIGYVLGGLDACSQGKLTSSFDCIEPRGVDYCLIAGEVHEKPAGALIIPADDPLASIFDPEE